MLSTITVINTADSGAGSLRQAILDAKDGDVIGFDIPGPGVQDISLVSPLPTVNVPLTIDGYTQPGTSPNTLADGDNAKLLIEVDGFKFVDPLGDPADSLITIASSDVTVRGLAINGDTSSANRSLHTFVIQGPGGDVVEGNFIGTDATGTAERFLGQSDGILIDGAPGNTIGGLTPAARNIVSGNSPGFDPRLYPTNYDDAGGIVVKGSSATANLIEGNYIGTDVTGTKVLPNLVGVLINGAPDNTVGGATPQARNLISGNGLEGIKITGATGTDNLVLGNYIGVDVTGQSPLPSGAAGVDIESADNTVGGLDAADRNVILRVLLDQAGATGNRVEGNFIGTDSTGDHALKVSEYDPINQIGVRIIAASGNTIGGTVVSARNVISSIGGDAIFITDDEGVGKPIGVAGHNLIAGNNIGVDVTGTKRLSPPGSQVGSGVDDAGGSDNTIGGTTSGARNLVSGNNEGIALYATNRELVEGNYIGTDTTGTIPLGNAQNGVVAFGTGDTIGGTTSGARNLVSANLIAGVEVGSGDLVEGNFVGTDASGALPLGNGQHGIDAAEDGCTIGGTTAGSANVIAFNGMTENDDGVLMEASTNVPVFENSIFANHGQGIRMDAYAPANSPVLTLAKTSGGVTQFQGTLSAETIFSNGANTVVRVEFFANPAPGPNEVAQGMIYLGFAKVTTDAKGNAIFNVSIPNPTGAGPSFTATATAEGGITSAFSSGIHGIITDHPSADVSVTGMVTAGPVLVGDLLIYTLTVQNDGPDTATGVALTDTLPAGVTFVSAEPAQTTLNGNKVIFSLGSLASKAATTIKLTVNTTQAGNVSNTAVVSGDPDGPIDPDSENNSSTQTVIVDTPTTAGPDVGVTMTTSVNTVTVGQQLAYTVIISNHSTSPASGVVLSDTLPAGVTLVSSSTSQGTVNPSPGAITADLGTLGPGASATVTFTVSLGSSVASLVNSALVKTTETDSNPADNVATLTTPVSPLPGPLPGPPPSPLPVPEPDGPRLIEIQRFGYHHHPTRIILSFDAPLDPVSAQDSANYTLTGPGSKHRPIPIASIHYDPITNSVTLRPKRLLNFHNRFTYQLTVHGSGKVSLTSQAGTPLDGNGDGQPGGDYRVKFHGYGKVFPEPGALARAKAIRALYRTPSSRHGKRVSASH